MEPGHRKSLHRPPLLGQNIFPLVGNGIWQGQLKFSLSCSGTSKLKEHLLEGSDYKLINEVGWKSIVGWYGVSGDQTPIKRCVVEQGIYNKQLRVEVYLIELKLSLFTDLERVSVKEFSKCTTIGNPSYQISLNVWKWEHHCDCSNISQAISLTQCY